MTKEHRISDQCLRKRKCNCKAEVYLNCVLQQILIKVPFFSVVVTRKKQLPPKKEGEIDPKLWELLLSAPKRDYEKICLDFGVTDFRWMLKRINQMKKEREDEQAKVL